MGAVERPKEKVPYVDKVCVVAGVGPGTGAALSRRFAAGGYRVAMLARDGERLAALEREIGGSRGYAVDVTDAARVGRSLERIAADSARRACSSTTPSSGHFGSSWTSRPRTGADVPHQRPLVVAARAGASFPG